VGPFLQNAGADTMTVAWIRHDDAACTLAFAPRSGAGTELRVRPCRPIEGSTNFFYEARLAGLRPDTRYAYSLRCPGGTVRAHFRTFPRKSDRLTFIYYGDNKGGHGIHRRLVSRFEQHSPLFVMHSGDMTDHGTYAEYRPLFFHPLRDVIDHIPLLPGRGNHEGNGKAYRQVFCLPDGDTWYSVDCAHVHIVVLDTTGWRHEWEKDDIRRMYEWLDADLSASRATWKIAMHHEPSYDLGWRKDDWGLQDFLPLMRRHGVDLTLSGHAHGYQRLHPMAACGENERHPITHIISAGAGASIGSKPLDPSPYLAADARRFNYLVFTVEGERLAVQVLSEDDETLDAFELVKHDGRYDPAFLARAMPAEDYPKGKV
jgi:hypothetical protein